MASNVPQNEEAASGRSSGSGFHYRDADGLFDDIKPDWNTFVRRLLNKHDAWERVAMRIYPLDETSGTPLEQQKKTAVDNVRRALSERLPEDPKERETLLRSDRRPRHFALLWLDIIKEEIPGAGVDIAHFAADKYGTERGAVKVDTVRLKDEFDQVKSATEQVGTVVESLLTQLQRIGKQLDRIEKER